VRHVGALRVENDIDSGHVMGLLVGRRSKQSNFRPTFEMKKSDVVHDDAFGCVRGHHELVGIFRVAEDVAKEIEKDPCSEYALCRFFNKLHSR
jgi:hypothetical protein